MPPRVLFRGAFRANRCASARAFGHAGAARPLRAPLRTFPAPAGRARPDDRDTAAALRHLFRWPEGAHGAVDKSRRPSTLAELPNLRSVAAVPREAGDRAHRDTRNLFRGAAESSRASASIHNGSSFVQYAEDDRFAQNIEHYETIRSE